MEKILEKSHSLEVSTSKLLEGLSGNIKIPNRFLKQSLQKTSKTEKMNTTIEFCIFEIVLGTKFQLNLTIMIFWTKLTPKKYFQSKNEKMKIAINIRISLGSEFQLQQIVLIFWKNFS